MNKECVGKNETINQAVNNAAAGGKVMLVGNPYGDVAFDKNTYWNRPLTFSQRSALYPTLHQKRNLLQMPNLPHILPRKTPLLFGCHHIVVNANRFYKFVLINVYNKDTKKPKGKITMKRVVVYYTGFDAKENQRKYHDKLAYIGYSLVTKPIKTISDYSTGEITQKANLDIEIVLDMFNMIDRYDMAILISGISLCGAYLETYQWISECIMGYIETYDVILFYVFLFS